MPRILRTPIPEVEKYRDIHHYDESKDLGGFGDKYQDLVSKPLHEIMYRADHYQRKPFLSIAKDLVLSLKEGLLSELVVVSSTIGKDNRKEKIFKKTFAKFPLKMDLELNKWGHFTRTKKRRADWIKNKHPDFDIFIDDSINIIEEARENFASQPDKNYVLPDYKFSRHVQGPNVYHVKTTVSDIQPIHFAIGALEYRLNKLEQGIRELKQQKTVRPNSNIPTWLTALPLISGILALLVWIVVWKKSKK